MHVQNAEYNRLRTSQLKGGLLLYYRVNIKGFDATVDTQKVLGPTMVGPGGKFSNLRFPNAWKMLFWYYLLYIKIKSSGAI